MTQSGHARSIGGGADSAALLRAALATDLARTGRLRFRDAADGVLQMRRAIGQGGWLDRHAVDGGAEQRLPEIAPETVLQEIGRAHAARSSRLLAQHHGDQLAPSRVALATTLYPESQMNPVFIPSAP